MPRKKRVQKEGAPANVPPSLTEDPAKLREEAANLSSATSSEGESSVAGSGEAEGPGRKRGRPRKDALPWPTEAIGILHQQVWDFISQAFQSEYKLSPEGAMEMARYADLCLRQYVSPILADHSALAAYSVSQLTALFAVMALRKPKPKTKSEPVIAPASPEKKGELGKEGFEGDADLKPRIMPA